MFGLALQLRDSGIQPDEAIVIRGCLDHAASLFEHSAKAANRRFGLPIEHGWGGCVVHRCDLRLIDMEPERRRASNSAAKT